MFKRLVRNSAQLFFPQQQNYNDVRQHYQPQQFSNTVCLLPYVEPAVKTAIKDNKYYRTPGATVALATALDRYVEKFSDSTIHIIPIPQSYRRWRERGFDHLEEIINQTTVAKHIRKDVLRKSTHTDRQAHVSKKQRLEQQAGSFSCDIKQAQALNGIIILLDDVITTGSTMQAARATLAPHLNRDATLVCLALAH